MQNEERISLVEAIARMEGFGKPGSRATRNHNPGNLNYSAFSRAHGATAQDDKGYAYFPSNREGFAALRALLGSSSYHGKTFKDAITKFCPPTGDPRGTNDTAAYVANVCVWCHVKPEDIIDRYIYTPMDAPITYKI
jgi:hypothetical protein